MKKYTQLKHHRSRTGLSMTKLANRAGVGRELVSKLEKGGCVRDEKAYPVVHALNDFWYKKNATPLDPEKVLENCLES